MKNCNACAVIAPKGFLPSLYIPLSLPLALSLSLAFSLCFFLLNSVRFSLMRCDVKRCDAMRCGSGFASKPFPRTLQATLSTALLLPPPTTMLCSRYCTTNFYFFFLSFRYIPSIHLILIKQRYCSLTEILCQTKRKFLLHKASSTEDI